MAETKKQTKMTQHKKKVSVAIVTIAVILLTGCTYKPEKFVLGKDECAECKMTIMDPKFGGEIITKKGKIYKFDDAHCVAVFMERRGVEMSSIRQTLFADYNNPDEFVKVKSAEFVVSSQFRSPMGGNAAAFKSPAEASKKSAEMAGSKITNWATLYNILIK
jgi:copper chaperone NosL